MFSGYYTTTNFDLRNRQIMSTLVATQPSKYIAVLKPVGELFLEYFRDCGCYLKAISAKLIQCMTIVQMLPPNCYTPTVLSINKSTLAGTFSVQLYTTCCIFLHIYVRNTICINLISGGTTTNEIYHTT